MPKSMPITLKENYGDPRVQGHVEAEFDRLAEQLENKMRAGRTFTPTYGDERLLAALIWRSQRSCTTDRMRSLGAVLEHISAVNRIAVAMGWREPR